ncbi:glucoamylase family protein [Sphingobacterium sp. Mn56C]|uniref:glucoamylase family protein n=1 Tax=Sphingobacterium sp. Mn56C TaxID=3395261 RepID=UPI003BC9556B
MQKLFILFSIALLVLNACFQAKQQATAATQNKTDIDTDTLLDRVQRQTFNYFWDGAEPHSGMARERIHMDGLYPQQDQDVVTIGGTGFGIMAIIVAADRGFIPKADAVQRLTKIVDFLATIPRFKGAWAHWYDGPTGTVKAFSEKDNGGDIVETAFLAQGLVVVREYFKQGNTAEKALADLADSLWKSIDWNHYTQGEKVLYWHWSEQHGFGMNHPIRGFDECLIAYVLGAASPTYPISKAVYDMGWARSGALKTEAQKYGIPMLVKHNAQPGEVGPLFWSHYSFIGLNPMGLSDNYVNYGQAVVNHANIHITHAEHNPHKFVGYGKDKGWGLTASYSLAGYSAHHPDNDIGVISPTAALSSMPYTPNESQSFMRYLFTHLKAKVWGKYGFYDAYSETENWYPQRYLAIDQGPIVCMIENYRSGLLWRTFMQAEEVQSGLKKLGFEIHNLNK